MDFRDRRTLIPLVGSAVALVAGGLIAWSMVAGHRDEPQPPPPASKGGLIIDTSMPDDGGVDPSKSLRCFVDGAFVGEMSLSACAQRNGVATDALDVGVDQSGALAAAGQAGTLLTPLPPAETATAAPPVQGPPAGACWSYAGGQWRRLPGDMTLEACTATLFTGKCERPGSATYGRWMQQTLRLVPGRIEISSDNHSFRRLSDPIGNCPPA